MERMSIRSRFVDGLRPVSISFLFALVLSGLCVSSVAQVTAAAPMTDAQKAEMAGRVRQECLRSWEGYKKYAWGHDELKPLSHEGRDWYGHSVLSTPVDALDTLVLMGLQPQADEDRKLIDTQLNLDQDISVSNFEIT